MHLRCYKWHNPPRVTLYRCAIAIGDFAIFVQIYNFRDLHGFTFAKHLVKNTFHLRMCTKALAWFFHFIVTWAMIFSTSSPRWRTTSWRRRRGSCTCCSRSWDTSTPACSRSWDTSTPATPMARSVRHQHQWQGQYTTNTNGKVSTPPTPMARSVHHQHQWQGQYQSAR